MAKVELRNCLKSLTIPDKKVLEVYESRERGLMSLWYASDFYPQDTTERLFRQFLSEVRRIPLPHSQVNKGERMSGREILAAMRVPCP
jgi:hypothetical protein